MGVPSNVSERITRLELAMSAVERRRRDTPGEQARRMAVEADRRARRPLLLELAVDVFGWRDALVKSRDGQRLWSLIGPGARVLLDAVWFWHGLPIPEGNAPGAHTRVFLDGPNHHFLFEEWRNDDRGTPYAYQEACRAKSPLEMVDLVHPLIIEGLQTRLSGPEAWQPFIDELDRRLDRYVTAP